MASASGAGSARGPSTGVVEDETKATVACSGPVRLQAAALCSDSWELFRVVKGGAQRVELRGSWQTFKSCTRSSDTWSSLRGLSLSGCRLNADGLASLAGSLPPNLTALGVSGNPGVATEAWQALWQALPAGVEELDLGLNRLEDKALTALCEDFLVPLGAQLAELRLDGNHFRSLEPLAVAFEEALPRLAVLDLSCNMVDDPGLTPLAEQLHGPRSLRFLRLSGNELIGTEVGDGHGVAVLFAALPRAKSLQVLELDSTGVDDAGLEALQLYLTDGGSLKELHLERTQITDAGLHALMVAGGCALEKLYMGEGAVSQESLAALAELVATGGEAARPQTASRRGAVDEAARPMTGSRRGAAHEAEAGRPLTGSRRGAADAAGRPATGSRRSAADEAARPLTGSRRGTADDAADRPLTGSRRSAVDEAARPLTGVRRSAADEADRPLTSSWRNTADEVNLQPRAVSSVAVAAGAFATLPAPEVQNYLRRWFHGSVPVHVKFANQRLADELVYIGSLEEACVAEVDVEPSKKQPVRLLTDDEKAYLTEALMDKMREVEIRYELDSEIRSTPAWQDHVRALYFPKIEQLKKDVARLSSDYIFVAREG
eukprot:TRINITY_DN29409_c0_g1_i1.p1 TRINITY_DN29409_c0_g1~~TRINITY_DN29409_c0_g1_i1.p1  ORF type:complete len:604 (+),score=130.76 TRINITY_DN29409_c0_g1_i1:39-1850(+)